MTLEPDPLTLEPAVESRPGQRERRGGLAAHFGDFLRWLCFLLLLTAGLALGVLYLIQTPLDEEIRKHIEHKFQTHYPGLIVTLNSARRLAGHGIELRGLSIIDPANPTSPLQLAFIDELLIRCKSSITDLICGRAAAEQIVVRRPKLQATRQPDGTWNVQRLWPLPKLGDRTPPIRIESGAVEIFDRNAPLVQSWKFDGIELNIIPTRPQPSVKDTPLPAARLQVTGQLASRHFKQLKLDGQVDLDTRQWSFLGTVHDLAVSAETMAVVPAALTQHGDLLQSLRGAAQLGFRANSATTSTGPLSFHLAVRGLFRGHLQNPALPRPIRDIEATFQCDNSSLTIEQLTAQVGPTKLTAAGSLAGWRKDDARQFELSAKDLVLDDYLKAILPEQLQQAWHKFQPRGVVDVQLNVQSDGHRLSQDLKVACQDVSFAYHQFPYPLTGARGEIHFKDGVLRMPSIQAFASRSRVNISADIVNPGRDFTGWLEVSVEDPVRVDDRLIDALPEKNRRAVRLLNPQGKITFSNRYERAVSSDRPQTNLRVGLRDCSIKYDKFRYPIYGINGTLNMTDDQWSFQGLQGSNDSGFITCDGGWGPNDKGGGLWLDFTATDVPLADELHDALDAKAQDVWKSIRPRGTIDQLKIAVRQSKIDGLSLDVTAHQHPPAQNVEGRSITVKPSWFPYQLDQVIGMVRFHDGHVVLQNIRGKHGKTDVELSGQVEFDDHGWRVLLSRLNADRLLAADDLTSALPSELGEAVAKLHLTGPISISGRIKVSGRSGERSPDNAEWQLAFDLENAGVDCGVQLEHIHGEVTLLGRYEPRGFHSSGMLNIDSCMYQGIQLTDVRGPLSIDRSRVGFGQWSSGNLPNQPPPRPLLAATFGGTLVGSGEFSLADSRYELEAHLQDAELGMISRQVTNSRLEITGKTYASLKLHGLASGFHTLRGEGHVRLREADIYELPLMIQLLKLLSLQPPDETAFTSSDVKFRVEDDIIYFDKILFEGDAISLDGRGEMNLEKTMNLTFDTSVGRDDGQLLSVLVRPFLKEAGRRLMALRVTGSLDDPQIVPNPFPDVIQQVFPANGESTRPATSRLPRPSRLLDGFKSPR